MIDHRMCWLGYGLAMSRECLNAGVGQRPAVGRLMRGIGSIAIRGVGDFGIKATGTTSWNAVKNASLVSLVAVDV